MTVIVVADKMEKEVLAQLKQLGEVIYTGESADKAAALQTALVKANVLIVRSATTVTEELVAHAKHLKVVARAGVGLDNVKLTPDYCKSHGIEVINTPAASTKAVAFLTLALMSSIMRKVGFAHVNLKAGQWVKGKCTGEEPGGKTLGVVGMGRIGREVAKRAQDAFEMNIVYTDLHKADDLSYQYYATLDEMLPHADVVSLHAGGAVPLLTKERIAKMRKGAYLINTSRGALVDETALVEALKSGHLAGAAIDVFEKEPKKDSELSEDGKPKAGTAFESPLRNLDNVILTPHIGASTHEAQARIGADLIEQLKRKLAV
jgi:D-3-phosphoglycerate dehydrogenase